MTLLEMIAKKFKRIFKKSNRRRNFSNNDTFDEKQTGGISNFALMALRGEPFDKLDEVNE